MSKTPDSEYLQRSYFNWTEGSKRAVRHQLVELLTQGKLGAQFWKEAVELITLGGKSLRELGINNNTLRQQFSHTEQSDPELAACILAARAKSAVKALPGDVIDAADDLDARIENQKRKQEQLHVSSTTPTVQNAYVELIESEEPPAKILKNTQEIGECENVQLVMPFTTDFGVAVTHDITQLHPMDTVELPLHQPITIRAANGRYIWVFIPRLSSSNGRPCTFVITPVQINDVWMVEVLMTLPAAVEMPAIPEVSTDEIDKTMPKPTLFNWRQMNKPRTAKWRFKLDSDVEVTPGTLHMGPAHADYIILRFPVNPPEVPPPPKPTELSPP